MSSVLLAVMSYPGANATFARHWPYFERQQADWVCGIGTTNGKCEWPDGVQQLDIGESRYIDGSHLPRRMLDTIEVLLLMPWRVLILCEYDTVFFKPIPTKKLTTAAGHLAGGKTWGSKANAYYHNPWVFTREIAIKFLYLGRAALEDGICPDRESGQPSTPECSPDVFFGYVMEQGGIPVQIDLWREYSRNSFDLPGHLEEAQVAYRDGVDVIHGIKTKEQLDFILS